MEIQDTKEKTQEKTPQTISMNKLGYHYLTDVETCDNLGMVMELSKYTLNKFHNRIDKKCYIIQQVWENEYFRNCQYAKGKLKRWQEMLDNGTAEIISVYHLFNKINKEITDKNIKYFMAYNGFFDKEKILYTFNYFKANDKKESKLADLQVIDLWEYAKCIFTSLDYIKWAIANEKFTPKGKIQTNAEALKTYICETRGFVETHIGIEDLEIEYEILQTSLHESNKKRQTMINLNVRGSWQIVERARKQFALLGKI